MTKNDAVERAVEALRVAKNVEAAFHEFSDSPQDAIATVGEILGRWNSCFADELQALQTSRPDADNFIKTLERIADMAGDYGTPNGLHDYVCDKLQQMRAKNGP